MTKAKKIALRTTLDRAARAGAIDAGFPHLADDAATDARLCADFAIEAHAALLAGDLQGLRSLLSLAAGYADHAIAAKYGIARKA